MSRRKNGTGTFYKKSNNNGYEYRIMAKNEIGEKKPKYFTGKTKEACLNKYNIWKRQISGDFLSEEINSSMSVKDWANFWYDNYVINNVKITTISDDRSILDCHIIPALGDYKLKDVKGITLQKFYNGLANKDNKRGGKLSTKTIKNIYTVVNRMFVCAYNNDLIESNVNKKTQLSKLRVKRLEFLTNEEHNKILEDCFNSNTTYDYIIAFLMCTGTRLGEALGLQWDNIDRDKNLIKINRELQAIPNTDNDNKHKFKLEIIKSTKTIHSNREIPILEAVVFILAKQRKKFIESSLKFGEKFRKDLNLVFFNPKGYFICDTELRKFFNKKLERLGIKHYRLHDLRHDFATRINEGKKTRIKTLSDYLGHSSVGITQDIYVHSTPESLSEVITDNQDKFLQYKKYYHNGEKFKPNDDIRPEKDA